MSNNESNSRIAKTAASLLIGAFAAAILIVGGPALAGTASTSYGEIAADMKSEADKSNAREDLANVALNQELAQGIAGYAGSVEELQNVPIQIAEIMGSEYEQDRPVFRSGMSYAVRATSTRDHFVIATLLPSGALMVRTDTMTEARSCAEYGPACFDGDVDVELVNWSPEWVTF